MPAGCSSARPDVCSWNVDELVSSGPHGTVRLLMPRRLERRNKWFAAKATKRPVGILSSDSCLCVLISRHLYFRTPRLTRMTYLALSFAVTSTHAHCADWTHNHRTLAGVRQNLSSATHQLTAIDDKDGRALPPECSKSHVRKKQSKSE